MGALADTDGRNHGDAKEKRKTDRADQRKRKRRLGAQRLRVEGRAERQRPRRWCAKVQSGEGAWQAIRALRRETVAEALRLAVSRSLERSKCQRLQACSAQAPLRKSLRASVAPNPKTASVPLRATCGARAAAAASAAATNTESATAASSAVPASDASRPGGGEVRCGSTSKQSPTCAAISDGSARHPGLQNAGRETKKQTRSRDCKRASGQREVANPAQPRLGAFSAHHQNSGPRGRAFKLAAGGDRGPGTAVPTPRPTTLSQRRESPSRRTSREIAFVRARRWRGASRTRSPPARAPRSVVGRRPRGPRPARAGRGGARRPSRGGRGRHRRVGASGHARTAAAAQIGPRALQRIRRLPREPSSLGRPCDPSRFPWPGSARAAARGELDNDGREDEGRARDAHVAGRVAPRARSSRAVPAVSAGAGAPRPV